MTNLTEKEQWEDGVYQIEKTDPVVGGPEGLSNRQGLQLANRTRWLKARIDGILDGTRTAALAIKLATARAVKLTGDATATGTFDGSADLSLTVTLADTGVAAGTYGGVTLDKKGRAIAATTFLPVANGGTGNGSGQAVSAAKLATARTINGVPFDGTANIAITDDSKAPLNSPVLLGDPRAPTPAAGDNDTSIATTAFVQAAIATLVNGSPEALNQLNELAAALGNNPNYATDMAAALGLKANSESPTLSGLPKAPTAGIATNTTQIATTAFVQAVMAAYGLAGYAPVQNNTLNLNDAPFGGLVRCEGAASNSATYNWPVTGAGDTTQVAFEVFTHGLAGPYARLTQFATEIFGSTGGRGRTFVRVRHDTTWYPWREFAFADQLAKVATGGRFADLATEIYHWMAGKSAANGWKNVYLQNQEPTGNVSLEMANSGGYTVLSYQGVQDGAGGWGARFYYTPPGDTAKDRRIGWLGISTAGEVQLGNASLPAGRSGQILTSEGDQSINGNKRFFGEVQTTSWSSYRLIGGDFGSFWRNDGAGLYLLFTAKGSPYGDLNSLRPLTFNLTTGKGYMPHGVEVQTVGAGDRSVNAASTAYVLNAIGDRAGAIDFFAMSSAPAGYLKANGAAVSRTTYATLFAAIGTTFGAGDGSTTFNLPDIRGEFLRGWDDGRGVDSGRAFASGQASQNLLHDHPASTGTAGAHNHTMTWNNDGAQLGNNDNSIFGDENRYGTVTMTTSTAGSHTHSVIIGTSGGNESRPRNLALLACIKY
ncbi:MULTISPECIES: tail fiber protein [unclassified Pseudomonas]|uniref:tail fiber protein n=1 Tax=unclassified Pseudomonas TaxID=196821 RepID=UPI0023608F36|nr:MULTISPECIES: tail fiber protein [unclassified Pseudomonas]